MTNLKSVVRKPFTFETAHLPTPPAYVPVASTRWCSYVLNSSTTSGSPLLPDQLLIPQLLTSFLPHFFFFFKYLALFLCPNTWCCSKMTWGTFLGCAFCLSCGWWQTAHLTSLAPQLLLQFHTMWQEVPPDFPWHPRKKGRQMPCHLPTTPTSSRK